MTVVLVSRCLVAVFVASVTFWYCVTPLLVQPHPRIINDLLTQTELHSYAKYDKSKGSGNFVEVENWTKWRLYVNINKSVGHGSSLPPSEGSPSKQPSPQVIYGGAKDNILLESTAVLNMEWRSYYDIHVRREPKSPSSSLSLADTTSNSISVQTEAPFLSFRNFGIYDHFTTKIVNSDEVGGSMSKQDEYIKNQVPYTIQIIPRFLFGIPYETIQSMYGSDNKDGSIDLAKLPIIGIFSNSPSYDRFIIQAYMNLVTMSVIFLLWANNPPETLMGNKSGNPKNAVNENSSKKTNSRRSANECSTSDTRK